VDLDVEIVRVCGEKVIWKTARPCAVAEKGTEGFAGWGRKRGRRVLVNDLANEEVVGREENSRGYAAGRSVMKRLASTNSFFLLSHNLFRAFSSMTPPGGDQFAVDSETPNQNFGEGRGQSLRTWPISVSFFKLR